MPKRPHNASRARELLRQIPGLTTLYHGTREAAEQIMHTLALLRLQAAADQPFVGDPASNTVVSLTSFPARIEHAWIAIESVFQQQQRPWKVVLVLAQEEFPDGHLPLSIRRQEARGLEILWTDRNSRSFKKLLPTRAHHPAANIVTIDDDILYEPWRLSRLLAAQCRWPGALIGHRGWVVSGHDSRLDAYSRWPVADSSTSTTRVLLTSGAGMLFPPGSLPLDLLLDVDLALALCPTADDIWFWAVAQQAGTPMRCLGHHGFRRVRPLTHSPALSEINWLHAQNDAQLLRTIDHFDLWKRIGLARTEAAT